MENNQIHETIRRKSEEWRVVRVVVKGSEKRCYLLAPDVVRVNESLRKSLNDPASRMRRTVAMNSRSKPQMRAFTCKEIG